MYGVPVHYYLPAVIAQSAYGSDDYGASLYSTGETSSQAQAEQGLVDTGSPIFIGTVVGLSIIIMVIFVMLKGIRKGKK